MQDPAFNDHRTRRALDELADMLLTGPVQMPSPFVSRDAKDKANGAANGGGSPAPASPSASPLRLHRPSTDTPRTAMLEGVMLGHLPGFAGPWVAQYADLAAHAAGASGSGRGMGLIRLAGSAVELELYGDAAMLTRFERRPTRCDNLDSALAALAEYVTDYALLIDSPDQPAAHEHLAAMDRWTILTAANDAAIVAAYRLLKSLLVDARVPPPARGIRLSFAGCDDAAATSAAERIARAGAAFLKTTVKYAGARSKMQPVRRVHVGRFDAGPDATLDTAADTAAPLAGAVDPWRRVLAFFQPPHEPVLRTSAPVSDHLLTPDELTALTQMDADDYADEARVDVDPPEAADHADEDARTMGSPAATHPIDDELEQRLIRSLQDEGAPQSRPDAAPAAGAIPSPAKSKLAPIPNPVTSAIEADTPTDLDNEPAAAVAAASSGTPHITTADPDALAAYLDGARPLAARCPHHPDVELAVEHGGRLALSLAADADQTSHAIRTLLETRTWAAAHRSLLALTDPAAKLDAAADPVCHLFTNEPRVALQLAFAGLTDTRPIRLHLLKRIEVAGRPHVLHEPLS